MRDPGKKVLSGKIAVTAKLVMYERLSEIGPFGRRDRKPAEAEGRQRGRIGFASCETIEKRMDGRQHGSRFGAQHPGHEGEVLPGGFVARNSSSASVCAGVISQPSPVDPGARMAGTQGRKCRIWAAILFLSRPPSSV